MPDSLYGVHLVKRSVSFYDNNGNLVTREIEVPSWWNETQAKIVASRYLCNSAKKTETSVVEMFDRVSRALSSWAKKLYKWNDEQVKTFYDALMYFQLNGYFAFNSPVYFNLGLPGPQLCSACYVLAIEDTLDSIYDILSLESRIFKLGAGSGYNTSPLRSKLEPLSSGGSASGPVSFLKLSATGAEVVLSGGRLRRAAKLVILNADHLDIFDFISCKVHEENKARVLLENEVIKDPFGEVAFQSVNISIGASDDFMNAVINDKEWVLQGSKYKDITKVVRARDIMMRAVEAAHKTGDPGLVFIDTINRFNCDKSNTINATNPCSEFCGHNFSSCNLASINIAKFYDDNNNFDFKTFDKVVKTLVYAMTAICYNAYYPDKRISKETKKYAAIGIGFTNVVKACLDLGLAHGSPEMLRQVERFYALLHGLAFKHSAALAEEFQPYERYNPDHKELILYWKGQAKETFSDSNDLFDQQVLSVWDSIDPEKPFANEQVTLQAPTGTISFIMGAESFGIEPFYAHTIQKRLMDGETITIPTPAFEMVLIKHFDGRTAREAIQIFSETGEPPKWLPSSLKALFKVAVSSNPEYVISAEEHLRVSAAAQKWLSGAISKTVNLPNSATPKDIENVYLLAWKLGLKGVTVYRDGSKAVQALYAGNQKRLISPKPAKRIPLPKERNATIHKARLADTSFYVITGTYPSGDLGEVFIQVAKEGSTLSGLLDGLCVLFSIALQHGVPLETIIRKFRGMRFDPSGFTGDPEIPSASSILDYLARYLEKKFLTREEKEVEEDESHGILCTKCGAVMRRRGSCFYCDECGSTTGSCE